MPSKRRGTWPSRQAHAPQMSFRTVISSRSLPTDKRPSSPHCPSRLQLRAGVGSLIRGPLTISSA
eukprot:13081614-Heterocapsa_arctica.AAC.1